MASLSCVLRSPVLVQDISENSRAVVSVVERRSVVHLDILPGFVVQKIAEVRLADQELVGLLVVVGNGRQEKSQVDQPPLVEALGCREAVVFVEALDPFGTLGFFGALGFAAGLGAITPLLSRPWRWDARTSPWDSLLRARAISGFAGEI